MELSITYRCHEELQPKVIDFLRFPLIVGVVFIHSSLNDLGVTNNVESYPIYTNISHLFTDILSRIAVPLFFIISGFLFFNGSSFTIESYAYKIKKRVKTLLIPYIFWNLLSLVLFFLQQSLLSDYSSGNKKLIVDWTISDYVMAFWNMNMVNAIDNPFPICSQFWFIRDLMVVMILSPIVYFFVKRLRIFSILILGAFYICGYWFDVVGFSITALFFFSAGAYFSIFKKNMVTVAKQLFPVSAVFYILTTVILCLSEFTWYKINIIIGIFFAIGLSSILIEKSICKTNTFLSKASFFIFAYHMILLPLGKKMVFKLISPESDLTITMFYFLLPISIIAIGVCCYYVLRRYFPVVTGVISGGR